MAQNKETFGERLKLIRKNRNLTQKDIAVVLGCRESTISSYENNKRSPDLETISKISELLNVTSDYLITGRTEIREEDSISEDAQNLLFIYDNLDDREQKRLLESLRFHIKDIEKGDGFIRVAEPKEF